MNINEEPKKLKEEEQRILDELIGQMNKVIDNLDEKDKEFIREAQMSSDDKEEYIKFLLAKSGMKYTKEALERLYRGRDELYFSRLFVHYEGEDEGIEEIKVGLHTSGYASETFVYDWKNPICRHYILDNSSNSYLSVVKDKFGVEFKTLYKLLVRQNIELRFTSITKAMNIFPGEFDVVTLELAKKIGFFGEAFVDYWLQNHPDGPEAISPEEVGKIIYDEFLQELLKRRHSPEFVNIVRSIQKKQGEIIGSPYDKNIIVQGCAGSGKSMIMLHRLPILLYDNPDTLKRNSLYVITPSPMYIQMAEHMRHQLEISDLNMGTEEQYYDYCIGKYPGHTSEEYGKISHAIKVSNEQEKYIYSRECLNDIENYYENMAGDGISLAEAYDLLKISGGAERKCDTFSQKLNDRILKLQAVLNANNDVVVKYYRVINDIIRQMETARRLLTNRQVNVDQGITKMVKEDKAKIVRLENEIANLDLEKNATAVSNRLKIIDDLKLDIEKKENLRAQFEQDTVYLNMTSNLEKKMEAALTPFTSLKSEFDRNTVTDIYDAINRAGELIGSYHMLRWEYTKLGNKYSDYGLNDSLNATFKILGINIDYLEKVTDSYLPLNYYSKIRLERNELDNLSKSAVMNAYKKIMGNIGITADDTGKIKAAKCSPYIYLQAVYLFQGAPANKENLLAIDEAQSISPEEMKLLKNLNGENVIINAFGDIHQHIEGTKGVDSWEEFKDILNYASYELQENYRNVSKITEYCNRVFGMDMRAINIPGKDVIEISDEDVFKKKMTEQLTEIQREGVAAIIVENSDEAKNILKMFGGYTDKFNDMIEENLSINNAKWNIMNIDDAKGLEFSTVVVLSGNMTRNQRYIAYTRALDELIVYSGNIDKNINFDENKIPDESDIKIKVNQTKPEIKHKPEETSNHKDSKVRDYFESQGLEVIDNRDTGGRLWVMGEKTTIRPFINAAMVKFMILGKYTSDAETGFRNGWCTKTDK